MLNRRHDAGYEQRVMQHAQRMEPQAGEDVAAEERHRAVEAQERQAEGLKRLDQATLLSGRVQLDPTPTNRTRLQLVLTMLAQSSLEDPGP